MLQSKVLLHDGSGNKFNIYFKPTIMRQNEDKTVSFIGHNESEEYFSIVEVILAQMDAPQKIDVIFYYQPGLPCMVEIPI